MDELIKSRKKIIPDHYPNLKLFQSGRNARLIGKAKTPLHIIELFQMPGMTHSVWVRKFCVLLFRAFGDEHLSDVAAHQATFAEAMLPPLTKAILATENPSAIKELRSVVNFFFENIFSHSKEVCALMCELA